MSAPGTLPLVGVDAADDLDIDDDVITAEAQTIEIILVRGVCRDSGWTVPWPMRGRTCRGFRVQALLARDR